MYENMQRNARTAIHADRCFRVIVGLVALILVLAPLAAVAAIIR